MVFRKPDSLIELEQDILDAVIATGSRGSFGFEIADRLGDAGRGSGRSLLSHGTLYKALDRLRTRGLLQAAWEDEDIAHAAGRPRRRYYTATAHGAQALAASREAHGHSTRLGSAPA